MKIRKKLVLFTASVMLFSLAEINAGKNTEKIKEKLEETKEKLENSRIGKALKRIRSKEKLLDVPVSLKVSEGKQEVEEDEVQKTSNLSKKFRRSHSSKMLNEAKKEAKIFIEMETKQEDGELLYIRDYKKRALIARAKQDSFRANNPTISKKYSDEYPLHAAAIGDDAEFFFILLENSLFFEASYNLNSYDESHYTPLELLIVFHRDAILKELIRLYPHAIACDFVNYYTEHRLLHLAIKQRQLALCEFLIAQEDCYKIEDYNDRSPFEYVNYLLSLSNDQSHTEIWLKIRTLLVNKHDSDEKPVLKHASSMPDLKKKKKVSWEQYWGK